MAESIDQVIQDGQSLSSFQQKNPRNTNLKTGMNKTELSPPLHTSPSGSSQNRLLSPRQDQIPLSSSMDGNTQAAQNNRYRGIPEKIEEGHWVNKNEPSSGDDESSNQSVTLAGSSNEGASGSNGINVIDFFGAEVFQIVIHNPTTAHRLLKFCQSRACGENMEFLQKVNAYNRLLGEVAETITTIHKTYICPDAPRQINIPHSDMEQISADVKQTSGLTLPNLENTFAGAQDHIEKLLASDIYPRFVKHQVTALATSTLADHRERFQGLGDCFCLTDPSRADNPILFASDGFVSVTGYPREDIIPRNCRFLQGDLTDPRSVKRLRQSIDNCEETVELLLNYRKNGDPFWNLLYVSPLLNERGDVVFFLGGQINCSTTIHSCTDVLKILMANDDELDRLDEVGKKLSPTRSRGSGSSTIKPRSAFFKSRRKYNAGTSQLSVRDEAGMEPELINRLAKLTFKTQVEAFYTAYSKYLVLNYHAQTQHLIIQHYSPGIIDMLCLNLPNGSTAPIFNKDIFRVLSEHSLASSSVAKVFKQTVRVAIREGRAVSVEIGLLTGYEERKTPSSFHRYLGDRDKGFARVEEKYVMHWTPLKDEEGMPKWVVLTIAPKI